MLSYGNNNNNNNSYNSIVDGVARIFLDNRDDDDVKIITRIKTKFPMLSHEERLKVMRQVAERFA